MTYYDKEDIMKWVDPNDNNADWVSTDKEPEESLWRKIKRKLRNIKDNLVFNIKYTLNDKLIFPFKNILRAIKNIWVFRKVVSRYRWWDFEFTMDIFMFSLEQQIKNWDNASYIGAEFTKKRMIVLLKRLREFEEKRDELIHECYAKKLYSRDVLRVKINELTFKTWYSLGRNIRRFWD